jgi:antitoxin component YwqK of YwqJK toxin-antitoxin module
VKYTITAFIMEILLIQAAPPSATEYREGLYYEANSNKPYSGYLTKYYPASSVKESEGKIKEGLMDDEWIFYYPNGTEKCELEYEDGIKLKILKSWYDDHTKESEFDETSQVYTTWFRNGQVKSVSHYLYGLKQGSSKEWYENGAIKSDYTYYTHHEHGVCREYFANGRAALVAVYRDGKKNGFWQAFYPDGKLKYQGRYSDDFKTGRWITRDSAGKLTRHIY